MSQQQGATSYYPHSAETAFARIRQLTLRGPQFYFRIRMGVKVERQLGPKPFLNATSVVEKEGCLEAEHYK